MVGSCESGLGTPGGSGSQLGCSWGPWGHGWDGWVGAGDSRRGWVAWVEVGLQLGCSWGAWGTAGVGGSRLGDPGGVSRADVWRDDRMG